MTKMVEDATKKVRQLEEEGKNVTRWGIIYNLAYFNLVQSGCFQCKSTTTIMTVLTILTVKDKAQHEIP